MKKRRDYVASMMASLSFPEEAMEDLLQVFDTICAHPDIAARMEKMIVLYEHDLMYDHKSQMEALRPDAETLGLPFEAPAMICILCMTEHLKQLYLQRELPIEVFWKSMDDIRCKLFECKNRFGFWGNIAWHWYGRFFDLTRFGLGRLQFEPYFTPVTLETPTRTLHAGELVVKMHIPSSGPFPPELCEDSFRQAAKWFAPLFPDGVVPFFCISWLMAPEHQEILKPDSNMRRFQEFFTLFPMEGRTVENDLWRVFGIQPEEGHYDALPRDTSLRRAYAKALETGNLPHMGRGVFWMKDGEFL